MLPHEVFAPRIPEDRERLSLTQAEVAERVDTATEAYDRAGARAAPSASHRTVVVLFTYGSSGR